MIAPPSELQFIPFPPFGLKWYASPPSNDAGGQQQPRTNHPPPPPTCTAFAICGGGGAAKTGFANCVHIVINVSTEAGSAGDSGAASTDDHEGSTSDLSGERTVDIDTGPEVGLSVSIHQVGATLWVLVAIGRGYALYFVPLLPPTDGGAESVLAARGDHGEDTTCEAVSFNPSGSAFAAGYENGKISFFTIGYDGGSGVEVTRYAELHGEGRSHVKAIDTLAFHPTNLSILASCAKDGTCRIWDLQNKTCIDTLFCKIYDSNRAPPTDKKITDPKPGQLLVRGCAFGDPEGGTLYTVQSGRRGSAYLSVWSLVHPPPKPGQSREEEQNQQPIFQEVLRKAVAPVPISAMSLSGDYSALALGDTAGTVTLYSTAGQRMRPVRTWVGAHETPVTCIAARPSGPGADFPGEERTGVTVDVMTASFDNKLLFLTRQRRSRLAVPGPGPGVAFYLVNLAVVLCLVFVSMVSYDACREEMVNIVGLREFLPVRDCLVDNVFWAPNDRPGVAEIPT